jgi:cell filamentation protein
MPNGVLRNKLGIADHQLLAAAEADITRARLTQLTEHPLPGTYDLDHFRAFHAAIFGDLYPWAGQLRTVDISKRTGFCRVVNLGSYAADVFGRLASADRLRGRSRAEFVRLLAELYADLNALHPFREGNGRTQRAFLAQLSAAAGHPLSWAGMSPQENQEGSIKSFLGDNSLLERMLDRLVAEAG